MAEGPIASRITKRLMSTNQWFYLERYSVRIKDRIECDIYVLYPWPFKISGARYSGVPQNVLVMSESFMFNLHSPKSHNAMWPV